MKTLKINILTSMLMLTAAASFASVPKPKYARASMNYSIAAFVEADTRGNCAFLNQLIEDNAKFNLISSGKVYSFDKKQMMSHFKQLQNVEQNCKTSYALLEAGENYALYKVVMQYPTFIRTNYVTVNNCSEGWKVSNVTSVLSN